jgi:LDH2 family malate/lactate/ureidoglycolate dehydrogenase
LGTLENLMADPRFRAASLIEFAAALLIRAGLPSDRAGVVAEALTEGDLLGHTTHGLQLLPLYLAAIAKGALHSHGEPTIVSDRGSAITWDGNWLPGPWLMRKAMDVAFERASDHPVVTLVIRRAGHIGCLAVYPRAAAERDMLMILSCSDPSIAIVAPHGAVEGRMTPNPIAAAWPTENEPVLFDVSPSTTTSGMVARTGRLGNRLLGRWLIDRSGNATDDPGVLDAKPAGAIMPLGGKDLGHKGFALGLLVEALTGALAGFGRADKTDHWGATVFMQIIDPAAFAGITAFRRETSYLAQSCRTAATAPGVAPVRLPGERAQSLRFEQLRNGVKLHSEILPAILGWAQKYQVAMPNPLSAQSE